ncbi:hypothetical protein DL98DRAFT_614939 [Cadophora sp. DSE1049]|nr:hypothetical protein DL98DRAFT_614939 [Cadophora sp. DSE1049]
MCWLTESYHICSHWGPRQVQTFCARGELSGSATGCWDNTILGVTKLPIACPSCRYRAEMETPFQVSHVLHDRSSSDDEFEVRELSRKSLGKKPLTLDKLAADQDRDSLERKEKEWVEELEARWEARWNERLAKEAVGKEGGGKREDDGKSSSHGKWFAWRGFKSDELPKG